MHLSAAILGWGMARDLSTLLDNFKPGMGGIGLLLHLRSGIPGGKTLGICNAAANLQMELFGVLNFRFRVFLGRDFTGYSKQSTIPDSYII